ncbi:MAG: hypothetical protein ACLQF1_17435 [Methyloceanibacter sp.]
MRFSPSRAAIDAPPVDSRISRPALFRRAAFGAAADRLREAAAGAALTKSNIGCLLGGEEQI